MTTGGEERQAMLPVRIRPAEERDIPAIAELEAGIFTDAWSKASVAAHLAGRANAALVAETVGEAALPPETVGYLLGMRILDEAEVYRVAVRPAYRGRGVGETLLEAFLTDCRKADGFDVPLTVSLEVRSANLPAVRLYEKAGFRRAGLRKDYYRDPADDAVLMRLER